MKMPGRQAAQAEQDRYQYSHPWAVSLQWLRVVPTTNFSPFA